MNPSSMSLMDVRGYGDHHLIIRQWNPYDLILGQFKHDVATRHMALDILPGPHPFIGDCHGLPGINVFQNSFRGIGIHLTAEYSKHQAYRDEQAKQNPMLIHFFLLD